MTNSTQNKATSIRKRHLIGNGGPTDKEREYLEVIYYLSARGEPVIAARLAKWMGVQPPTVTHIVKQLEDKKLIVRDAKNEIELTSEGFEVAEALVRRHRILERFLVDVMNVPWEQIHQEAVRLEHALSPLLEARITELVGMSETCPHGNPIPGNSTSYPGDRRLDQVVVGTHFTVRRIVEEAEEDPELMHYVQSNGLTPGATLAVSETSAYGVTLQREGRSVTIPLEIASTMWGNVTP
jgi:DtxR family Mn-dependent transcriptional regulator